MLDSVIRNGHGSSMTRETKPFDILGNPSNMKIEVGINVTCFLDPNDTGNFIYVEDAKMQKEEGNWYICQNCTSSERQCQDRLGYTDSYFVGDRDYVWWKEK